MGRSYLIDHCVRYYKNKVDEQNFRVALTETNRGLLGLLTGNLDEIPSYAQTLIHEEKQEEETAEEVIERIRAKITQNGE